MLEVEVWLLVGKLLSSMYPSEWCVQAARSMCYAFLVIVSFQLIVLFPIGYHIFIGCISLQTFCTRFNTDGRDGAKQSEH